jgi:iron(II)-dependent oxidoreductase
MRRPPAPWQALPARPREPLWLPAGKARIGSAPGGWVPRANAGSRAAAVPEFEIDAQAVTGSATSSSPRTVATTAASCWTDAGWAWLQASGRRAPRDVEQLRGGVLVMRRGRTAARAGRQPVMHVSAPRGRGLVPLGRPPAADRARVGAAALSLQGRGFVWGDVFEWVAGSARPWPGQAGFAGSGDPFPAPGSARVCCAGPRS